MVDILDVVVPAYSAGITVDLLDYHKINGKKTVDKYVDIQQEQLEEVISYWDDEREVKQATYFAPENGKPGRVVVVMCSVNYNYSDAFERALKLYENVLKSVAAMYECIPESRPDYKLPESKEDAYVQYTILRAKERSETVEPIFMRIEEKSGNPIEALHDMWFGKKETPIHEDAVDAMRYAIYKSLSDTVGLPIELLDPNGSYEFDTESGKLTNTRNEDLKARLRTMATSAPGDIEKQIEQWRERLATATYENDATKCMEEISAATGMPLEVVKRMYLENPGMADTYEAAYAKEDKKYE